MAFSPERLKEARKALTEHGRSVSQERFAEMLGVSRRSPSRWEAGGIEPRMAQLTRIAEVTGRPMGFFFDEPETFAANGKGDMMADLYTQLGQTLIALGHDLRAKREQAVAA